MDSTKAGVIVGNYRYEPLGPSNPAGEPEKFRLLTIHAGSGDEDIECSIDHHDLPRGIIPVKVPYEALSWTWGEDDKVEKIVIRSKENGDKRRIFPVKPNLHSALKQLRLPKDDRVLWVDYVCINQDNAREKDLQVKIIFHIYRRASNVCIWLGEHENESEKAIAFIKHKVNDLGNYEDITGNENLMGEWKALAALMDRKWFRRRWVVQELALAKTATVYCGDETMDWSEFEIAVSLFERDAPRLAGFYQAHKHQAFDHEIFGDVAQMGATRLVQLRSNLFRFNEDGEITEWRYTLGDLVSNLWSYEAKEPHDMIYAILSLAQETQLRLNISATPESPVDTHSRSTSFSQGTSTRPPQVSSVEATSATTKTTSARTARSSTPARTTRGGKRTGAASSPNTPKGAGRSKKRDADGTDAPNDLTNPKRPKVSVPEARTTAGETSFAETSRASGSATEEVVDSEGEERLTDEERSKRARLLGPAVSQFKRIRQPQNRTIFHVEYEQEFFLVCKQFLKFTIPKTDHHNLDILLRPWAPEKVWKSGKPKFPLPSWIPMVAKAAFERTKARHAPGGYKTTRVNADPLVGQYTDGSRSSYYNACKTRKAHDDEWTLDDTNMDDRLFVRGFVLDTIDEIKDASQYGNVTPAWLTLGGWSKTSGATDQATDRLWRTLVADRGPDGSNTKEYYRKAFEQAVEDSPGGGVHTTELKHRGHPILKEFLKRVEAVVTNRRIFRSKETRNLGLAPDEAETNDYICILRGMSVPIVLRPVDTSDGRHYKMIGECFLHTMMDGRGIDVSEERIKKLRKAHKGTREEFEKSEEFQMWGSQMFVLR